MDLGSIFSLILNCEPLHPDPPQSAAVRVDNLLVVRHSNSGDTIKTIRGCVGVLRGSRNNAERFLIKSEFPCQTWVFNVFATIFLHILDFAPPTPDPPGSTAERRHERFLLATSSQTVAGGLPVGPRDKYYP